MTDLVAIHCYEAEPCIWSTPAPSKKCSEANSAPAPPPRLSKAKSVIRLLPIDPNTLLKINENLINSLQILDTTSIAIFLCI